ncbi:astacin-like [Eriocheir sinensis]|uniref:astacin-like n=1 Tax=Eriocheir sinensis TaxID=95602 RepID=UPI0021CA031F|nr:astacin-like [Eriocheir sinensis]
MMMMMMMMIVVMTEAAVTPSTPPSPPSPPPPTTTTATTATTASHRTEDEDWEEEEEEQTVFLWHGGVVPYVFGDSITASQRSIILQAMGDIHNKTCVRFTHRHSNETDHIEIHSDRPGCRSSVGRAGGRQTLHLNAKECMDVGTVIHELLHILGLFHEHSRADRSRYITVNLHNVIPEMRPDFAIVAGRSLAVGYNYDSILHYGPYAFSKSPGVKQTIVPKDPEADIKDPWQRTEMADTDALYVNELYRDQCRLNVSQE